jgi:molybdenum cofactor cytidylyltransferase
LAAGGSSRLGKPKQLVFYKAECLVHRAVRTATESKASQVIVVVGADAEIVTDAFRDLDADVVLNANWQLGMGRSIRSGMEFLASGLGAVVVMLCDMPLVTPELLDELAEMVENGEPAIAAAEYNCHLGVPCAFHSSLFPTLLQFSGDKGARELIRGAKNVARVTFQACAIDVDTPEDLERLKEGL